MKLHMAVTAEPKVWANLARLEPLNEGESWVAFYDDTVFDRGTAGLVLTTKRLLQLRKGKVTWALLLNRIDELRIDRRAGNDCLVVPGWGLEQVFGDAADLQRFLAELSPRVQLKGTAPAEAAAPRTQAPATAATPLVEALKTRLDKPNVRAKLEKYVPLAAGEEYLAFHDSSIFETADSGLAATNRRLVSFKKQTTAWSVPLDQIQAVDVSSHAGWHEFCVHDGERAFTYVVGSLDQPQICDALASIVSAAQAKEGGADQAADLLPEHGAIAYTLKEAVHNPQARAELEQYAPLNEGEEYVAFYNSSLLHFGESGLLLTNQCLLHFKKDELVWSVELPDIAGIECAKGLNEIVFREEGGELFHMSIHRPQICRALAYLVAEAQGKAVGSLHGLHMTHGGEVALPLAERFFALETISGTSAERVLLRLRARFGFPHYCAWCKSPDVVSNQEVLLRAKVRVKSSLSRKVGGLLVGLLVPVAGAAIAWSGQGGEGDMEMVLSVPVCEKHQIALPLQWRLCDLDLPQPICFVDLGDRDYAAEVVRNNADLAE